MASDDTSVRFSFHTISVHEKDVDGPLIAIPKATFDKICDSIVNQKKADVPKDKETREKLKKRELIRFYDQEKKRIDSKTLIGMYQSCFWGSSFENEVAGKISANSLNYRPFTFLLYLSKTGRIYVGCQYIGLHGDWFSIEKYVVHFLRQKGCKIKTSSLMNEQVLASNATVKAVEVTYISPSNSSAKDNVFSKGTATVLVDDKADREINQKAREVFNTSFFGKKLPDKRKEIAKLLSEGRSASVDANQIRNAKMIILPQKSKKTLTIHLTEPLRSFATQYPVDVQVNSEGHTDLSDMEAPIQELLDLVLKKNEI